MSQGKTYTFQRKGLENTIISVIRGQRKSGIFFQKPAYFNYKDVVQNIYIYYLFPFKKVCKISSTYFFTLTLPIALINCKISSKNNSNFSHNMIIMYWILTKALMITQLQIIIIKNKNNVIRGSCDPSIFLSISSTFHINIYNIYI